MTTATPIPRLQSLESLRGLMAVWVMFCHIIAASGLAYKNWPKPFYYLGFGNLGVDVFIIISGFVIFLLLDQKKETYKQFIVRRFFRIYPVYLICLLFSIPLIHITLQVLQSLHSHNVHNALQHQIYLDTQNYFVAHLITHLFLLHGLFDSLFPSSSVALLGPAWSLSLEWQFYLVAPLLLYLFKQRARGWFIIFLILTLFISTKFELGIGNLLMKMQYFLVGMGSYFIWRRRTEFFSLFENTFVYLIPVTGFLILMLMDQIPLLIWEVFFLSLIAADQASKKFFFEKYLIRGLEIKILQWIGKISYPIYLVHFLVMYTVMFFMKDFVIDKKIYFLILLLSVTCFTLFFSILLHKFVEKPSIALGRRI